MFKANPARALGNVSGQMGTHMQPALLNVLLIEHDAALAGGISTMLEQARETVGCGENVGKSGHVIGLWRAAEIAGHDLDARCAKME